MQERRVEQSRNPETEETEEVARDLGRQAAVAEEVSETVTKTVEDIDTLLDEINADEDYSEVNAREIVASFRQLNGQ